MRFRVQRRFRAPVAAVIDVLVDPDFHRELELPDVRLLAAVEHRDDGDVAFLTLRFEYTGRLDANVRRLLRGRRLTWVQELAVERGTGEGRLAFAAENAPDRLHGEATFRLHSEEDDTVWDLSGDVKVRVPLVGPSAERAITAGFLDRLDVEVWAITDHLRTG